MGRSTRAAALQHRDDIVNLTAARIKRDGLGGVKIPQIMSDAGLTVGGFYRHFDSKDDLTVHAVDRAFALQIEAFATVGAEHPSDHAAARRRLIELCLTSTDERRRLVDADCLLAALAGDVSRSEEGSPVREAFVTGVREVVEVLARLGGDPDDVPTSVERADALATLASVVGAAVLSRAAAGHPLSEEVLDATHTVLGGGRG